MAQVRERGASYVPLELGAPRARVNDSQMDSLAGRQVDPGAIRSDEAIGDNLRHTRSAAARAPPLRRARFCTANARHRRRVLQKLRIQLSPQWCVFSPLVNHTAARWSSSSKASPPASRSTSTQSPPTSGVGRVATAAAAAWRSNRDRADILSGVRAGETIGGPIAMSIENRDWVNWQHTMRTTAEAAARCRRRTARAGDATAPGARRSGRRGEVRPHGCPRHPRARQRARNGGPRRRRRGRTAAARRAPASASPATCSRSARRGCPRARTVSFDDAAALRPTRRFAAWTPTSSVG